MAVELNHTIVHCTDKEVSAGSLAELLGVAAPTRYGPFLVVQLGNGVSLDFADDHGTPHPQHYAFLVGADEFDQIHARITERGLSYWADPFHRVAGQVNTNDGGRGLYWDDPDVTASRSSPCPTAAPDRATPGHAEEPDELSTEVGARVRAPGGLWMTSGRMTGFA